jgi:hypothetical protein
MILKTPDRVRKRSIACLVRVIFAEEDESVSMVIGAALSSMPSENVIHQRHESG